MDEIAKLIRVWTEVGELAAESLRRDLKGAEPVKAEAPKRERKAKAVEPVKAEEPKAEEPKAAPTMTEEQSKDKLRQVALAFVNSATDGAQKIRNMLNDKYKVQLMGALSHEQRLELIEVLSRGA